MEVTYAASFVLRERNTYAIDLLAKKNERLQLSNGN